MLKEGEPGASFCMHDAISSARKFCPRIDSLLWMNAALNAISLEQLPHIVVKTYRSYGQCLPSVGWPIQYPLDPSPWERLS